MARADVLFFREPKDDSVPLLEWLEKLPAIRILAEVWRQQYHCDQGQVSRLTPKEMPDPTPMS